MTNTSIIACGTPIDIGCKVVLWNEPNGYSFYKTGKFSARNIKMEDLIQKLDCFVLHHSVTYTAKQTYSGLVGRGLSVNFIIDDDDVDGVATIYQCLDIKDVGWSHKPLNFNGPGVEISYQPTAWSTPHAYSPENCKKFGVPEHEVTEDTVHGTTRKVFAPTAAQVAACTALLKGYVGAFSNVLAQFPKNEEDEVVKTTVKNPTGLLAHFHITKEKMDPSGFPFEDVEYGINE